MRATGEAWMTIHTDNVIPKGKNGDWYLKRGYYAGMFNETPEEFKHSAGKFIGWVDNRLLVKLSCRLLMTKKSSWYGDWIMFSLSTENMNTKGLLGSRCLWPLLVLKGTNIQLK